MRGLSRLALVCAHAIAPLVLGPLVLGPLVLGGVAHADGAGVIAMQSPERAQVAEAMATAMTGRATRIAPDAVGEARAARPDGAVPVETIDAFRRVREQIDDGWRAYLRVAVEVAAVKLASARAEAEPLVALPGGAELYADAALRLGAVLGHLGRDDESHAVLALALALDPDRPITLAEFSPDVVDRIEAARTAPVAPVSLRIVTEPAGAAIAIDGVPAGTSPLTRDVPAGQHLVTARAPGHLPLVRGIAPSATGAVELELEPDPAAAPLALGAVPGIDEPAAQQLVDVTLQLADLDEVVVVAATTRRGGPTLLVQRCAGVPARCSAVVEVGYADPAGLAAAAREAWAAVRTGELRYAPTALGDRAGRSGNDGRCKVCRSPWLWGGVGAAVVIGAVVTAFALSGDDPVPIVGIDANDF